MLSCTISAQGFKVIARRKPQIFEHDGGIQCRKHGARAFDQVGWKAFAEAVLNCASGKLSTCTNDHMDLYHIMIHIARSLSHG